MTFPNTTKDKALILITAICCAVPFLYICYLVNRYAVDVPFWDDWAQMINYAKQRLSGYQGFQVMLQ